MTNDRPFDRRAVLGGIGLSSAALLTGSAAGCAAAGPQPYPLPPRMRGTSLETSRRTPSVSMVRQYAAWGINTVRINLTTDAANRDAPDTSGPAPTGRDPLAPYRQNLARLKAFTAACAGAGIGVILAADAIYGRRSPVAKQEPVRYREALTETLYSFWSNVARELRGDPAIFAYDVLNEPNFEGEPPGSFARNFWRDSILPEAVRRIRRVNRDIWLIVMPWPWGLPTYYDGMKLVDDSRVLYSFHSYAPRRYTHQGIDAISAARGQLAYPGTMRDFDTSVMSRWDRAGYHAYLKPVLDFRDRHQVRMMASEFGVVRWAPGKDRYVSDVVSIFEEEGLDWLFHSYGSWNGWNPTFAPDASDAVPREILDGGYRSGAHQVLLENWQKNRVR